MVYHEGVSSIKLRGVHTAVLTSNENISEKGKSISTLVLVIKCMEINEYSPYPNYGNANHSI